MFLAFQAKFFNLNIKYTVIIPVFNAEKTINRLLRSILKLTKQPSEIIVVDDASTDQTSNIIKNFKRVKLLRLDKNVGPAKARNIGAIESQTSWLLFIDSDCSLPKESLKYAFPSKKEQLEKIVGKMGLFDIKRRGISLIGHYKNMQRHFEIKAMKNPPDTFCSSCFTIKKEAFFNCGGFDENFGNTPTEDNEFYFRLIKKNLFIKYDSNFVFFHKKNMSLKKLFYDDYLRSKAIIYNIFGQLGEKRNNLGVNEIFKWTIELLTSFSIMLFILLLPISLLFLANSYSKIFLLILLILFFILILINFRFLKYSLKSGGIKMFTTHLFLRIFEMLTAINGISISIFELLLRRLRGI